MGRWKAFECRVKNPHHPHHLQIPYGEDFSLARRATNIVEVHLRKNRKTVWWHDSVDPDELQTGLERHAVGVTSNPYLANLAIRGNASDWAGEIEEALADGENKTERLMRIAVTHAAKMFIPEFERSAGRMGYVCAQVDPARAGDREAMMAMARRFHKWAPNIAVKLPATAAGLDVCEDCIAEGITITVTVSFTVPQAVAIAERHRRGAERATANGIEAGRCFAVIMIGRLDDYLRDVAHDTKARVEESDIRQTGLAATKRAYSLYQERGYEALLLVAALRGSYHMTELAGADLVMSIAPAYQQILLNEDLPREERIAIPVDPAAIERLLKMPEFVRSYEPDGMPPDEFMAYGATQRTLTQFADAGWTLLEKYPL